MTTPTPIFGAARRYTEQLLGGPTTEQESNPTVGAAVSQLVAQNPDRVGLLVMNVGTQILYIKTAYDVSSTNGLELSPGGGSVSFNVRDDFTLPAREFAAISPSGNTNVYVLEEIALTPTQKGTQA